MSLPERLLTDAEYLMLERGASYKSELVNGRMYAMAGTSRNHNRIVFNVSGVLHAQLRDKPCEAFASEMRVQVSPTGAYFYPDVVALCEEPRFVDAEIDTLLNPTVIIEVLSPSTQAFDRGDKFEHYRRIRSLRGYLLLAQDRCFAELRWRTSEVWTLAEFSDLDDLVALPSIGCALRLRDVYARVEFPADGARTAPRLLREELPPAYASANG